MEELLLEWVKNAVSKYGISKVVMSGGVAMNIKAMGKIAELDCIQDLFIGGSASDESLAIGSAICLAEDMTNEKNKLWNSNKVDSLSHLFLGPEASDSDEMEVIEIAKDISTFSVTKMPSNNLIANLLRDGKVIARCVGRMEKSARNARLYQH